MAKEGKKIVEAIGGLTGSLGKHLEKWGPLLLMFGLVERHGDAYKPSPRVSKAGAKFMGIGKDDEAIVDSIFGEMQNRGRNYATAAKRVALWYLHLKKFQRRDFRITLAQKFEEFRDFLEGDQRRGKYGKHSLGMEYAIGFFKFLAKLDDDKQRTKMCIGLNVFGRSKPMYEKVWNKAKSINIWEVVDGVAGEMDACNEIVRKNFLGGKK